MDISQISLRINALRHQKPVLVQTKSKVAETIAMHADHALVLQFHLQIEQLALYQKELAHVLKYFQAMEIVSLANMVRLLMALEQLVSQLHSVCQINFSVIETTASSAQAAFLQPFQIQAEKSVCYHLSQHANALRDTQLMDIVAFHANMDSSLTLLKMRLHKQP